MNDAGKVAFTPKGDYSSTVTYEYLDTVVYNGNAYAALKTTTGKAPTDSDTDENWKLLAMGGTAVPIAKKETTGVVKASSDIGVSDDGSMILKTDYTSQESLVELTSGESRTTFFGKIAKAVSTLISHITTSATSSVLGHVKLTNSTAVTDSTGLALPATEKNASVEGTLANQISVLNTNLTQCPTKIHKDYSVDNQSFEYKVNKLSLIFITYGNVQSADFYVCRCISATAYALVPIYKTGNLDDTYDINLDIVSKILTITSKKSWIQVDVISL